MKELQLRIPERHQGWVLVEGYLEGQPDDLVTYLVAESACGKHHKVAVPVTLKGRVREVFHWPFAPAKCYFEPAFKGAKPFTVDVSVSPLGPLKARLVMFRRVLAYYLRLSTDERSLAGLSWRGVVMDLWGSYRAVGRLRAFGPAPDYREWIARCERVNPAGQHRLVRTVAERAPRFVVWVDTSCGAGHEDLVQATEHSVSVQVGVPAAVCVGSAPDTTALVDDCWVVRLEPGVRLAPWALFWFAMALRGRPDCRVWYGDHDVLNAQGERCDPQFKPDWSPELAMASAFVGRMIAVRGDVFREVIGPRGLPRDMQGAYGFLLAAARQCDDRVGHVPVVLSHEPESLEPLQPCARTLRQYLVDGGVAAEVVTDSRGYLRVRYQAPEPLPLVSIIVPTRDMVHLLEPCITSVLEKTSWPNFEVLVVDNQSICETTLAFMEKVAEDPRVRVLRYQEPFNFAAINNFAVAHAEGEVVCLLNNDTEVIAADWLDDMVARLYQPGVGVVGARLLFANGQVQHAGDVLGPGGCATHLHGIIDGDDPGYMNRAVLPQELSAVTAACLVTHKHLYHRLEGLDEANLPVAFNDVDYCLRVGEAGYRVQYTPYAELYHHESVSRGKDDNPQKTARAKRETAFIRQRWSHIIERDPFYNPNLNYAQPDFRLGRQPRVNLDAGTRALFTNR